MGKVDKKHTMEEKPGIHKKNRCKIIILLAIFYVLLICISLLAFEIYLRYTSTYAVKQEPTGPVTGILEGRPISLFKETPNGRRWVPNSHAIVRNHVISKRDIKMDINSQGFRDHEVPDFKLNNEIRILALGDSITGGDYLQADEVYVERLEYYLNQSAPGGMSVEVINAGVSDVGLKEEVQILQEDGLATRPDIVMIAFYLNDSRPPWGFEGEMGTQGFLRRHSLVAQHIYKWLVFRKWLKESGRSRFADWAKAQTTLDWKNDRNAFLKLVSLADLDWGAAWEDASWVSLDPEFIRLKELSERYSFKTVFVAFPTSFQVYANFIEDKPQQKLKEITRKYGFFYFDLLPVLREHKNEDLFFDACHPRVPTNDLIGKALAEYLEKNVLADFFITSPEKSKQ